MEGKDNLSGPESPTPKEGMIIKELPAGTQIVAPIDGNVFVEYNKDDRHPDGSLKSGNVVIESKDPNGNVIRITVGAINIDGLLAGKDVPTQISEEGIVRSSQGVPVKAGEPLFTLKNNLAKVRINSSQGTSAPGNPHPAV